jgi:hypothetical protein
MPFGIEGNHLYFKDKISSARHDCELSTHQITTLWGFFVNGFLQVANEIDSYEMGVIKEAEFLQLSEPMIAQIKVYLTNIENYMATGGYYLYRDLPTKDYQLYLFSEISITGMTNPEVYDYVNSQWVLVSLIIKDDTHQTLKRRDRPITDSFGNIVDYELVRSGLSTQLMDVVVSEEAGYNETMVDLEYIKQKLQL